MLTAQMLYLPLDGDTRDHSGIGRHAQVASGQQPPSFTCLDKSVNCSALFTDGQCLTVPSLARVPFTSAEVQDGGDVAQVPKASFVVHFKRVPSGPPTKQGRIHTLVPVASSMRFGLVTFFPELT